MSHAASIRIIPSRLQVFEYKSVSFVCEGLTGWKISRKIKTEALSCGPISGVTTKSSCTLKNLYTTDSGEYWCEAAGGKRSNSVNITVTDGSVILESPVLPVMEGDAVTLSCRNKTTSSNLTAGFYKDGDFMESSATGNMTIDSVSKSDEGLYKCSISGAGESPESWLAVTDTSKPPSSDSTSSNSTPWVVVTVLLLAVLVVGLLHLTKGYHHRVLPYLSTLFYGLCSAQDQTVSAEADAAAANRVMYATVTRNRKKEGTVIYSLKSG
ncbi:low affinity immunoglobulin gamma Fc region receptor II-a-like [Centropristis striata]|uniref:low affinity immunoglobulin gamma Fc region receptor II-a-like n=1 Tax=Centropristis striata TaxID=184440 RepID=UPI0027E00FEB|nr:low affinity immunoglobulin gamma Fc region receptor II-a-like [Centropristis striata]